MYCFSTFSRAAWVVVLASAWILPNTTVAANRPMLHFDVVDGFPATIARLQNGQLVKKLGDVSGAVWSPRANWYAYYNLTSDDEPQSLQVSKLQGNSRKLLDSPPNEYFVWHPAWSNDGKRIATILMRETANPTWEHQADFSLKVIDVATSTVQKTIDIPVGVLELPSPETPSNAFRWSPNDKQILLSWASTAVIDLERDQVITITTDFSVADWLSDDTVIYFDNPRHNVKNRDKLRGLYRRSLPDVSAELIASSDALLQVGIVTHPGLYPVKVEVSPSGRRVAMVTGTLRGSETIGTLRIYEVQSGTVNLAHPQLKQLIEPTRLALGEKSRVIVHLEWSPDEAQLAAIMMHNWATLTVDTFDLSKQQWHKLADIDFDLQALGVGAIDFVGWHKALSWAD